MVHDNPKAKETTIRIVENNLTDEELIREFTRAGDKKAFSILVQRHKVMIRKIIYTVLCSAKRPDMEDIEQEVLLSVYNGLKKFHFSSSFTTWLYRICHNKTVDFIKREIRERKKIEKLVENAPLNNPEDLYLIQEKKEELFMALSQLKEKDRMIIMLKDLEQIPIKDISKILRLPIGTVKSRLHRGREKLSSIIEGKI